jgi:hypothetical protein
LLHVTQQAGPEISSVGETYEALMDGRGIALLASGNAPLVALRPQPETY